MTEQHEDYMLPASDSSFLENLLLYDAFLR